MVTYRGNATWRLPSSPEGRPLPLQESALFILYVYLPDLRWAWSNSPLKGRSLPKRAKLFFLTVAPPL